MKGCSHYRAELSRSHLRDERGGEADPARVISQQRRVAGRLESRNLYGKLGFVPCSSRFDQALDSPFSRLFAIKLCR